MISTSSARKILFALACLLGALALGWLAGCATPPPPKPEPPVIDCADQCFEACDTKAKPWAPPDPAKPEAWDFIRPQVVDPLEAELARCDRRRQACVQCIDDAAGIGVLKR